MAHGPLVIITIVYIEIPVVNANIVDSDQTPHSEASDLGLQCLPITLLGVSRLKRVNKVRKESRKWLCCLISNMFVTHTEKNNNKQTKINLETIKGSNYTTIILLHYHSMGEFSR